MGQDRGEICLLASELRRVVGLRRQRHCVEKHEPRKTRYSWETIIFDQFNNVMLCDVVTSNSLSRSKRGLYPRFDSKSAEIRDRNKHVSAINEEPRPLVA